MENGSFWKENFLKSSRTMISKKQVGTALKKTHNDKT